PARRVWGARPRAGRRRPWPRGGGRSARGVPRGLWAVLPSSRRARRRSAASRAAASAGRCCCGRPATWRDGCPSSRGLPCRPGGGERVDHAVVKRLRSQVGDRLAGQRRRGGGAGGPPRSAGGAREYARGRSVAAPGGPARAEITAGRAPLSAQEEEELATGIHAALFGVGRLQPLLEDERIENIDVNGYDRVFLGYADGREVLAEPVADSDEELV